MYSIILQGLPTEAIKMVGMIIEEEITKEA